MRAFLAAGIVLLAIAAAAPARAFDHGFNPDSPVTKFFENLKRPWCPPGVAVCSCCGKADAYPIAIDQEATIDGEEPDGVAHVIDGSAIVYPDGNSRRFIPNGTVFRFSGRDVTRLNQGNPTNTAWAFLGLDQQGAISIVWCVVPLPPSD